MRVRMCPYCVPNGNWETLGTHARAMNVSE